MRHREFQAASDVLGVAGDAYDIPDMFFEKYIPEIRGLLGNALTVLRPDVVIVPPSGDRHQDHAVVHEEAKRAFRFCSMLGFDIPYNEPAVRPTFYQKVDADQMALKLRAIKCYNSQLHQMYTRENNVMALAQVRGCEIRYAFAEAFEVIRWVA
jgi:LmbE family N-acetylglucosaminyl deacetylase